MSRRAERAHLNSNLGSTYSVLMTSLFLVVALALLGTGDVGGIHDHIAKFTLNKKKGREWAKSKMHGNGKISDKSRNLPWGACTEAPTCWTVHLWRALEWSLQSTNIPELDTARSSKNRLESLTGHRSLLGLDWADRKQRCFWVVQLFAGEFVESVSVSIFRHSLSLFECQSFALSTDKRRLVSLHGQAQEQHEGKLL